MRNILNRLWLIVPNHNLLIQLKSSRRCVGHKNRTIVCRSLMELCCGCFIRWTLLIVSMYTLSAFFVEEDVGVLSSHTKDFSLVFLLSFPNSNNLIFLSRANSLVEKYLLIKENWNQKNHETLLKLSIMNLNY